MMRLNHIDLPDDIHWVDETTPWAVGQTTTPTLDGTLVIQEGQMQAGRPITLESGRQAGDLYACVTRATVDALLALEAVAGAPHMTLHMEHRDPISVRWRRDDGPAIDAAPVIYMSPIVATDLYHLTLRLMQV